MSSELPFIVMVPATRSVEELQQSETCEALPSLKLPMLGRQRSLQNLIREELTSHCDDGTLEMAALLMLRGENADFDGATFEAPASETQDERTDTPAASQNGYRSVQDQETSCLHKDTRFPHAGLWKRLFKRCSTYM